MKKWLKISLLSVLGLMVVAGVLMWLEFGPLVKGAMSAEKLDDGLYPEVKTQETGFGCSALTVKTPDGLDDGDGLDTSFGYLLFSPPFRQAIPF